MITKPKLLWKIGDSWKVKTNAEPSKVYLQLIRVAGCILVICSALIIFIN